MTINVLHIIGAEKIGGVELSVMQFLKNSLEKDTTIQHFLCAHFQDNSSFKNEKIITLNLCTDTENPVKILLNAIKITKFIFY